MPATTKFESDVSAIEYGRRSTLVSRDPESNVTCQPGFQWASDSAGSSPCLVAAAVVGGCGTTSHAVTPLTNSSVHYNQPGIDNNTPANECTCSWAAYNLYSACTACQGFNNSILTWAAYNGNCGSFLSSTTYYPSGVPTLDNTSIPFYATTNPTTWTNALFDIDQAKAISEQGHADVYGAPLTTASSTPSSKSKSNAGAIGGGVAGGVVVLLIGVAVAWWLLRRRGTISRRKNGKPQELDSTTYSTQGHTRSFSDLTKTTHAGDLGYTNGHNGYLGVIGMQQLHPSGNSPSPFDSSVNMGSISSMGLYTTPPHQSVVHVDGPASTYNDRASTIISRYDSPSPSMQFMNRSQSPDSNVVHTSFAGGVNEMGVQPFILPPISTSPPPPPTLAAKYSNNPSVYESAVATRRNSQESIEAPPGSPPPPRRLNPPTYDDAVALTDSQQVASQRRETHGTGHRPPLPEKQPSQTSQTSQGSQDSSVWSAPTVGNGNEHGPTADLAAIDAYMNHIHSSGQRPGGSGAGGATEGVDTVPMLHTTAMPPGHHARPPASAKRSTMNTTIDDGGGSVLGGHREGGDGDSFGIA